MEEGIQENSEFVSSLRKNEKYFCQQYLAESKHKFYAFLRSNTNAQIPQTSRIDSIQTANIWQKKIKSKKKLQKILCFLIMFKLVPLKVGGRLHTEDFFTTMILHTQNAKSS